MISVDVDECSKSLQEYQDEVERKLKYMVAGFARELAQTASNNTWRNDDEGHFNKVLHLYKARAKAHKGMPMEVGFHKGAWTYAEGTLTFNPTLYSTGDAVDKVEYLAQSQYKIGDTFVIGAVGTAYEMLQARDDIEGETISAIMTAHRADLPRYYNEG